MNNFIPNFNELNKYEEQRLNSHLQTLRAVISHSGEKGRSLEHEVIQFLKEILPSEYGISTGFIVYEKDKNIQLSKQLDVIIYDSIRSGPIARLGSCEVFPLEAVYGYIEVKASILSSSDEAEKKADNSIEKCLEHNSKLRQLKNRQYYGLDDNSRVSAKLLSHPDPLSIRSYVFAFEASGSVALNHQAFAQRISNYSSRIGKSAHIHGIFVVDHGYFSTKPIDEKIARDEDYHHVLFTNDNPLSVFKWELIHSLSRFDRIPDNWTPAINRYSPIKSIWEEVCPIKEPNQ